MSTAWLRDLEEKVREAAQRLTELREENARLTRRVAELEAEAAAATQPEELAQWSAERDEIRERVEKMVEHLETLLDDGREPAREDEDDEDDEDDRDDGDA